MKKVVVIGGGNGHSTLLRGLKQFPIQITSVVTVCDDGTSTGKLRKEFQIPAVGDLRRVLISLAETEPLVEELFNYRFHTTGGLDGHAVGNLLLTAMTNITGNLSDGIEALSKVLNLKGTVLPITEDNVILMAEMEDGKIIEGEHNITSDNNKIKNIFYKEHADVNPKVIGAVLDADYIILSMGSLYTSIIPNLIFDELKTALSKSKAKIVYICNMMTQPGETDEFKASDHIKVLNEYLETRTIDVVLVNNGKIEQSLIERYSVLEQKDPVELDELEDVHVITNNYVTVEDNTIRHNTVLLALDLYSYFLKN